MMAAKLDGIYSAACPNPATDCPVTILGCPASSAHPILSMDEALCLSQCPAGQQNNNGQCESCPQDQWSEAGGICGLCTGGTIPADRGSCDCPLNFTLQSGVCIRDVVCANGGTPNPATNTCVCVNDWGGDACEVPERVCANGGTRDDDTNTCACADDWGGDTCESPDRICVNGTKDDDANTCDCAGTGYAGTTCETDIDECATNAHNCDPNARCDDTDGSFTCECNSGYSGNGVLTSEGGTGCTVIENNECAPTNPCGDNTMCNDPTPTATSTGDYVCSCASGFSGTTTTGGPASCANIDECDAETDNCHADAVCTDTVGSFSCNCKDGFSGDGVSSCDAIPDDECNPNPCGTNTVCRDPNPVATNTGDYVCSCGDGFSGTTTTGSPATCADVDECVLGTDTCGDAEKCRNTAGSFACDRLPEVWIVAPAGEAFRAAPESGCEIRKWTESCEGRDAALSDCTPDGEGMVTVGVVFDCGN